MAPCDVKCSVCGRCFRRESDKTRNKFTAEHQKPVQEQEGAVEYLMCGHWLRSRGGLAVHQWARQEDWRSVVQLSVGPVTGKGKSAWLREQSQ